MQPPAGRPFPLQLQASGKNLAHCGELDQIHKHRVAYRPLSLDQRPTLLR